MVPGGIYGRIPRAGEPADELEGRSARPQVAVEWNDEDKCWVVVIVATKKDGSEHRYDIQIDLEEDN